MADQKTSELSSHAAIDPTDQIAVVNNLSDPKVTEVMTIGQLDTRYIGLIIALS